MTSGEIDHIRDWFARHVTLNGQAYTLDADQARAVADLHFNTLVTARAGSGKTRVIVAKVAYLVAHQLADLPEIAIFMFNRTAAAEVNQRIADVQIDGHPLTDDDTVKVASTFHKFAYDLAKQRDGEPRLLSEVEHERLIRRLLRQNLEATSSRVSRRMYVELLSIVSSFIARAGQKYPGLAGLTTLRREVVNYYSRHAADPDYRTNINFHKISFKVYQDYLGELTPPTTDFNLLMSRATEIMSKSVHGAADPLPRLREISRFKFLMVDEYQDFSYLFHALIQAIRGLAPMAKLFAVGDDWQAINRFAGSDVDYFINFPKYFPQDSINIPLATNYRSSRRIVENANRYMLSRYDPTATPAIPFQRQLGKIIYRNPAKTRFDFSDIREDGLGDGQYYAAIDSIQDNAKPKDIGAAARLLKTVTKIIAKRPYEDYMLLHRHNFTSFEGISLAGFMSALREVITSQGIIDSDHYADQIRCMTMHKSKGLESTNVILLEMNKDVISTHHPHATIFEIFGDTLAAETADRERLLYVALTRAKQRLFILTHDPELFA